MIKRFTKISPRRGLTLHQNDNSTKIWLLRSLPIEAVPKVILPRSYAKKAQSEAELLYCNYPILHNSEGWAPFGYHYDINKWEDAIQTCHTALTLHNSNMYSYKTHAQNLMWKHSIYNPDIQERWRSLL